MLTRQPVYHCGPLPTPSVKGSAQHDPLHTLQSGQSSMLMALNGTSVCAKSDKKSCRSEVPRKAITCWRLWYSGNSREKCCHCSELDEQPGCHCGCCMDAGQSRELMVTHSLVGKSSHNKVLSSCQSRGMLERQARFGCEAMSPMRR